MTSWCSRNDTQIVTAVILNMNIIFIGQWLYGDNSEIFHCSDVFARRQKLYKQENFSSKHMLAYFTAKIWRHLSITSQLR